VLAYLDSPMTVLLHFEECLLDQVFRFQVNPCWHRYPREDRFSPDRASE
jgi:hypothetical protein